MPPVRTFPEEEDARAQTSLDSDFVSVFKRMKAGLYLFARYAILLIPSNRVGIECTCHALERENPACNSVPEAEEQKIPLNEDQKRNDHEMPQSDADIILEHISASTVV
jgi:hypothetical protein